MTLKDGVLQIINVLSYVSVGSVLLPIACYFFVKKKNQVIKLLFILLLASLVSDVCNEIYVRAGFRGYLILNIFFVVQITLLSQIFALLLKEWKIVFITLAVFWAFFILNSIFLQPINEYQSLLRLIGGLIILGHSVYYYFLLFKNLPTDSLLRYSPSWIVDDVSYYFSFNLFLFVIANYLFKNEPEIRILFWGFHSINNVIKNCLFAAGIYLAEAKNKSDFNDNLWH